MVRLASTVWTCCFIQPLSALSNGRASGRAFPSATAFSICRILFSCLFNSLIFADATSLYDTNPMTRLSSSTTGNARTSYRINRSSTCFSVIDGFALNTGLCIKSPTVSCCSKLASISSSTKPWRTLFASLSSSNLAVAEAALGLADKIGESLCQ